MYNSGKKSFLKIILFYLSSYILLIVIFLAYQYLTLPDVSIWQQINPQLTSFMSIRNHDSNYLKHRNKAIYKWYSYDRMPDLLIKGVIVAEDASFWIHEGIDWFEVRESIKKNITEGEFSRGGSTITQQVARNLYLSPKKTINRKVREWLIARELEKHLTKRRILELYLNIAEWGYNIFGIEAASQSYFGHTTSQLDLHQLVRLVAVLPNPLDMNPVQVSSEVHWRSKIILQRLLKYKFIEEDTYLETMTYIDYLYEEG